MCIHPRLCWLVVLGFFALTLNMLAQSASYRESVFIENRGQWDPQVRYLLQSSGLNLWITDTGVVYDIHRQPMNPAKAEERTAVFLNFLNSNVHAVAAGAQQALGYHNYFLGNNPMKWVDHVPLYRTVRMDGIYTGIDMVLYLDAGRPRYDLLIAPGADPSQVRMQFQGASGVQVGSNGSLVVKTVGGEIRQQELVAYQTGGDGTRRRVRCRFAVDREGGVGFSVGGYDHTRPLVVDPVVLVYSTYLGGADQDRGFGITIDSARNIYVAGYTNSLNFPTRNAQQDTSRAAPSSSEAFVTKLNADGGLSYSTYLGGGSSDQCSAIAVDGAGNAYVTGLTLSTNFPTTKNAQQDILGGWSDAFVTKLNADGGLSYSTYLGGAGQDEGAGIAIDSAGNVYAAGSTVSINFPTTKNVQQERSGGYFDAFVTKLNVDGRVSYSTYIGSSVYDRALGIAVDAVGNAYVCGSTNGTDFPTTINAQQATSTGGTKAFVMKLNVNGRLSYSTYLGGTTSDLASGIAIDSAENIYVTGYTRSTNFPMKNAQQDTARGNTDGFVTKLNANGKLSYSTYLGGRELDQCNGIAVDGAGNTYVIGYTQSMDFPMRNALQDTARGDNEVFVTKLSVNGRVSYSTYLGGKGEEQGNAIVVDALGNVWATGFTKSTDFPITQSAQQGTFAGVIDVFVAKYASFAAGSLLVPLTTIDFGIQARASHSDSTILLHNVGDAPLQLDSIIVSGTAAANFMVILPLSFPQTIPPYDSLPMLVRYQTANEARKFKDSATLWITASGDVQRVLLRGRSSGVNEVQELDTEEGSLWLSAVSPNPIGNQGEIVCNAPWGIEGSITITDLGGKTVATVFNGRLAGEQRFRIDARSLSAGSYFVVVAFGGSQRLRRFEVVR